MAQLTPTFVLIVLFLYFALLVGVLAFSGMAAPAFADFQYAEYAGTWTLLPNFSSLTPTASGTSGSSAFP